MLARPKMSQNERDTTEILRAWRSRPTSHRRPAQVLRFLADHCDRDGATYVLAKDASDERLRLYDLDALAGAGKERFNVAST